MLKKKHPVVSVIIPVYNTERFLERLILSLEKQTFKQFEIIWVNDGSTDNSFRIIESHKAKDKRFVLLNQENKGVSEARNLGLRHACGKYIMFADSDDFLHSRCIELAVDAIRKSQADICQFSYKYIGLNDEVVDKNYKNLPKLYCVKNPLNMYLDKKMKKSGLVWDKIYKEDIARCVSFRKVQPGEDDLYSFEIMFKAKKVSFLDAQLYYHTRNPMSIMHLTTDNKYYNNSLMVANEFYDIVKIYTKNNKINKRIQEKLKIYYAEKFLFKIYISKPIRNKMKNIDMEKNIKFVYEQLQKNNFNIKWRFKLVLFFLRKGYNRCARILLG